MKKYNINEARYNLNGIAKEIASENKADKILQYYKNSIIRTKDHLTKMFTFGQMHAYILKKYNFEIWQD